MHFYNLLPVIPFVKLHASGNDFILIKDNFNKVSLKKSDIIRLCNRKYGVGADGIIVIKSRADKTLVKFYNSDGTEPEMCINGARCVAYILKEMFPAKNIFRLILPQREVEAKIREVDFSQERLIVEINLGAPKFDYYGKKFEPFQSIKVKTSRGELEGYYISFDNPHLVVLVGSKFTIYNSRVEYKVKDLLSYLAKIGKECQKIFNKGINIEFVNAKDSKDVNVLFWERGVGWTDSCGSGSCAVAVVLKKYIFKSKNEFFLKSVGGTIKIKVDRNFNTYLEGESQKVFEGYFK